MNDGFPSRAPTTASQTLAALGLTSLTAGAVLFATGASTLDKLTLGTTGRLLVAGASAPAWSDAGLSYLSGALSHVGAPGITTRAAATQDAIALIGRAGGTSSFGVTLTPGVLTAARVATFPDAAITVAGQNINNAFSVAQTITSATASTTTGTGALIVTGGIGVGGAVNAGGALSATSLTATGLTPGRVPRVTTGGLLTDGANFVITNNNLSIGASGDAASASVVLSSALGYFRGYDIRTAGVSRWVIGADASDANFVFWTYTDAGAFIDAAVNIVRAPAGAITLARPVTCTGTLTVPDGSAAAPGIRLAGAAHGFYYYASTALAMTVGGVQSATFYAPNGSSFGSILMLSNPSAAERAIIMSTTDTSHIQLGGWQGSQNVGGQVRVFGSTHATKASYVEITRGATVSAFFDGSGILTVNSTTDATTLSAASVLLSGGLATAAGKSILAGGKILSLGATFGIGYGIGAGGTVTQATSRATGVTLSKVTGQITLFTAAGSATPATFVVTNTAVTAADTVTICDVSGSTNVYFWKATPAAGSFTVTFWTTGGVASDTPIIQFNVLKGATA